jgi:hypothetical protein
MGRDFTLSNNHPSILINGTKYHYGIDVHQQYMVESAHYEKDYWYFKEKEDLEAFLINLPESADRDLRLKLHADWREVTPEQRDAYLEQDKLLFRAMAAERVKNGTAQSFNMDLEGEHGPYEPQRIKNRSTEPPLARVERQLREWKTHHSWEGGLSEAGRLRVLEGELDWTGVAARDKEAMLAREIDFARITPEQFTFVYQDIATDKMEPADPAVAQALFDQSRDSREPRHARDALVRETFRLNHELGYIGFRHQYVNDPDVVKEWPDPATRERELRQFWDEQRGGTIASYRQGFANDSIQDLTAYRDYLRGILAGDLDGQIAYYNRVSDTGHDIRLQDDVLRELNQGTKAPPSPGELAERDPAPQQQQNETKGQAPGRDVRDTTRNLVESVLLDVWPRNGAIVDFGLKSQEHYEALYYPVREGELTPAQLDEALGKGEKLTALARSARSNPHRNIEFRTDWDELGLEQDAGRPLPSRAEPAK